MSSSRRGVASSNSGELPSISCPDHFSSTLKTITLKLRGLCSRFQWPLRRRRLHQSRPSTAKAQKANGIHSAVETGRQIRLASLNAAMFLMAPAVPMYRKEEVDVRGKSPNDWPRGILKQKSLARGKLRVSINLPDNEISVVRSKQLNSQRQDGEDAIRAWKGKISASHGYGSASERQSLITSSRSILDVLREVRADIIGLQNVRAEEEKGMRPLSELAEGLGMKFVFADSWAPEYGDAILSKWPIKEWKVQKLVNDTDFRNVLKATIEVPMAGEVNFHCTHLDHLDENWRMKQVNSILRSSDGPHILVGGINSLDETDYSAERWTDIVQYYEEIGKPTPKVEVMKYLKGRNYLDAKRFAGECEAVVVLAKGQEVQGTCKYGTRVDYILASQNSPYKFVPGSYGVFSSKGTSIHHIVKVDIVVNKVDAHDSKHHPKKQRIVKIDASSKGIRRTNLLSSFLQKSIDLTQIPFFLFNAKSA